MWRNIFISTSLILVLLPLFFQKGFYLFVNYNMFANPEKAEISYVEVVARKEGMKEFKLMEKDKRLFPYPNLNAFNTFLKNSKVNPLVVILKHCEKHKKFLDSSNCQSRSSQSCSRVESMKVISHYVILNPEKFETINTKVEGEIDVRQCLLRTI